MYSSKSQQGMKSSIFLFDAVLDTIGGGPVLAQVPMCQRDEGQIVVEG